MDEETEGKRYNKKKKHCHYPKNKNNRNIEFEKTAKEAYCTLVAICQYNQNFF